MVVFILLSYLCGIPSTSALRIFGQRTNYMSVEWYVRKAVTIAWEGWTHLDTYDLVGLILDTYVVVTISSYICSQKIEA